MIPICKFLRDDQKNASMHTEKYFSGLYQNSLLLYMRGRKFIYYNPIFYLLLALKVNRKLPKK